MTDISGFLLIPVDILCDFFRWRTFPPLYVRGAGVCYDLESGFGL